ncbi:MAG: hypothetical protein AABY22_09375 [Nanoarchaeota archaeon]
MPNQPSKISDWEKELKEKISLSFNWGIQVPTKPDKKGYFEEFIPEDSFNGTKENIFQIVKSFIYQQRTEVLEEVSEKIDKYFLDYCRNQNGLSSCKNCGLDEDFINQLKNKEK